jgi:hypothetical protein
MAGTRADTDVLDREGAATSMASAVADDLEAILPTDPRAPGRRGLRLSRARRDPGRAHSDGRAGRLGSMAAALFLGLAAGAVIARLPVLRLDLARSGAPAAGVVAPRLAATPRLALEGHARAAATPPPMCGAYCDYGDVLAADSRLRGAYGAAVHAGVPRPVLVDYRDRWWSLRWQAPTDPSRAVQGYQQMADELDRLAAAAPEPVGRRAERPAGAFDRLGAEIASIWR